MTNEPTISLRAVMVLTCGLKLVLERYDLAPRGALQQSIREVAKMFSHDPQNTVRREAEMIAAMLDTIENNTADIEKAQSIALRGFADG
jgi:hypothetical protein